MINVLNVIRNIGNGGTEKFLINMIKYSPKNINNIIVTYGEITSWKKELDDFNIKVIKIGNPSSLGLINNIKIIMKIIKENDIDVVYSYTHYNSGYVMLASFLSNVKIRITHSHRSESNSKKSLKTFLYNSFSKLLINLFCNKCLACSLEAKKSLFYRFKKVTLINNGININDYKYDEKIRKELRKNFSINDDDIVFGTVGRLDDNKNQIFLINLFKDYYKINKKSKLQKMII